MKQYHSDREQEEEEDMEQINHRQEAARCIKTMKENCMNCKSVGRKKSCVWCLD